MKFHTLSNWDKPESGEYKIIADAWWIVDNLGNPLFYGKYNAPQCNHNKVITETLSKKDMYKDCGGVKKLPAVFIPLN